MLLAELSKKNCAVCRLIQRRAPSPCIRGSSLMGDVKTNSFFAHSARRIDEVVLMEQWHADFEDIQQRLPCWLSRITRPRLVFLPDWWPARYGAWVYFHFVFIAPNLINAPDDVRRYLLGHEYGHIYSNHTVLHFLYWTAVIGAILGSIAVIPALGAISFLVLALIALLVFLPPLARGREYQADSVATFLFGHDAALRGALWMADKTGTMDNSFRRLRLRRLGWQG